MQILDVAALYDIVLLPVVLIPDQCVPVDQEHQAGGGQRPCVLGGHVVRDLGRKLNQGMVHWVLISPQCLPRYGSMATLSIVCLLARRK